MATACFCGRPLCFSSRMLAEIVFWLEPFFSGMHRLRFRLRLGVGHLGLVVVVRLRWRVGLRSEHQPSPPVVAFCWMAKKGYRDALVGCWRLIGLGIAQANRAVTRSATMSCWSRL